MTNEVVTSVPVVMVGLAGEVFCIIYFSGGNLRLSSEMKRAGRHVPNYLRSGDGGVRVGGTCETEG